MQIKTDFNIFRNKNKNKFIFIYFCTLVSKTFIFYTMNSFRSNMKGLHHSDAMI